MGVVGAPSTTYVNLQYAYDTLIFGQADVNEVIIIKWALCCFEAWLGLKINFLNV